MPSVHETAYPRLRASVTARDLAEVYTPTAEEISQANILAQGFTAKLCFLVLLKTFQRLGYFALLRDVPSQIITHISTSIGGLALAIDAEAYDNSGTRRRHVAAIRRFLNVKAYGVEAKQVISDAVRRAAETKEDLADIINVAVEELVRNSFELPSFGTLHEEAQRGRAEVNRLIYGRVARAIGDEGCRRLDSLFESDDASRRTPWQMVKEDVGAPTINHLRELVKSIEWLKTQNVGRSALASIPDSKAKQFAGEAKSEQHPSTQLVQRNYTLLLEQMSSESPPLP